MRIPSELYRPSLALLTDLYQLTMAYGYWAAGLADREAVFHLTFRRNPFDGGFAIACGLAEAIDYLEKFHFDEDDIAYLGQLKTANGYPVFTNEKFFDHLRRLRFTCDIDAVPEGTIVFPHEPLLRVRGPIGQAQLLETALLNIVGFQSLIATKAARVCLAAKGDPVFEFGLRRAQGVDGALSATRAAYIGGCSGTSNVFAGEVLGIPVVGTHAHSWVMAFDNELEAFMAYARIMPNNVVLLVDTYDTLKGVEHAIVTGKWLREQGHDLIGIRLDSGDLAHLSQESRRRLDDAGFHQTAIVASSELDEHIIASLKEQGAAISVWGVGTKLLTAEGDPSLSAVYKLSALRDPDNNSWEYKIKVSEQTAKVTIPGVLQVRRFFNSNRPLADVIYDPEQGLPNVITQVDLLDVSRRQKLSTDLPSSDLLVPIFHHGQTIYQIPALEAVRENARMNLARFPVGVKRFINPQIYSTGLEKNLYELRMKLILDARGMPAS